VVVVPAAIVAQHTKLEVALRQSVRPTLRYSLAHREEYFTGRTAVRRWFGLKIELFATALSRKGVSGA
jgi:hypothetical protein